MNNLKYKLYRFMQGRYGMDALCNFLYIIAFILLIINTFFLKNIVITVIDLLILLLAIFRAYSKNIQKRTNENATFLKIFRPITHRFKVAKMQSKDKNYKYFICPNCKTNIRVPKGKGKISITCPSCKNKFDAKS